jgi:hypothetical protein
LTRNFIKYPVYIGDENSYVKSSGNFYFGTYQFKNNTDLNFSNCGLDIAFRGNDAETLNGHSFDELKDTFVQHIDKGVANGVAPLGSDRKIDITYMPTAVTSNQGGFKQFRIMPQPEVANGVPEDVSSNATTLVNFVGEDGIYLDVVDGNTIKVKYKFADQVTHIASNDLAIENIKTWQFETVNPHVTNNDKHVTLQQKTDWEAHRTDANVHVTTSDKSSWNGHLVDTNPHVTPQQKTNWDNHLINADVHVSTNDKANWNSKADKSYVDGLDSAMDFRMYSVEFIGIILMFM